MVKEPKVVASEVAGINSMIFVLTFLTFICRRFFESLFRPPPPPEPEGNMVVLTGRSSRSRPRPQSRKIWMEAPPRRPFLSWRVSFSFFFFFFLCFSFSSLLACNSAGAKKLRSRQKERRESGIPTEPYVSRAVPNDCRGRTGRTQERS